MNDILKAIHAASLADKCADWIKSGMNKDWIESDLKTLAGMLPFGSRDQKIVLTVLMGDRHNSSEWEASELTRIHVELCGQ